MAVPLLSIYVYWTISWTADHCGDDVQLLYCCLRSVMAGVQPRNLTPLVPTVLDVTTLWLLDLIALT